MRNAWIVIAILLLLLGVAGTWAGYASNELDDVQMTGHGLDCLALGIFFSLIFGIGLVGLMFYSSRKGYDDPPGGITGNRASRRFVPRLTPALSG